MKKILISFGVILLVVILGFAGGFSYSNYKNLKTKEAETTKEVKHEDKHEDKNNIKKNKNSENENQQQVDNQNNQDSIENTQQNVHTNETNNSDLANQLKEGYNINDNEAQILANEINHADINKDGIITTNEMTPTLQKFAIAGKFQPAGGGASSENVNTSENNNEAGQPKYTAEDAKHMTDDEFLEAYKEGMSEKEAATVDKNAAGSDDYINFLRGQVEANANGNGGTY